MKSTYFRGDTFCARIGVPPGERGTERNFILPDWSSRKTCDISPEGVFGTLDWVLCGQEMSRPIVKISFDYKLLRLT